MTSENDNDRPDRGSFRYGDPKKKDEPESNSAAEAMDALIAGLRAHRGTVMDDQRELTDDKRDAIRARWQSFKAAQENRPKPTRITNNRLAREIGEKGSTLSQVLSGKYPKSRDGGTERIDKVLRKVDQFITKYEESAQAPKRGEFAWIEVAKRIKVVANTTVVMRSIGVCYGSAGIGKTSTLRALLDCFAGSFLITIDDSNTRTVRQLMAEIAEQVKVGSRWSSRETRRMVADALRGSQRLCMVDEAHLAPPTILNVLRQLHDECDIPIFLVGMPRLASNLMKGRGDNSIGATLYSRVQIACDLEEHAREGDRGKPLYSIADIRKVFASSQLRIDPAAIRWLHDTANSPEDGGLRAAAAALRMAEYIAGLPSTPQTNVITVDALQDAAQFSPHLRNRRIRRPHDNKQDTERVAV